MENLPDVHSVWQCKEDSGYNSVRCATVLSTEKSPAGNHVITFARIRIMSDQAMRDVAATGNESRYPKMSYDIFAWLLPAFLDSYEPMVCEDN